LANLIKNLIPYCSGKIKIGSFGSAKCWFVCRAKLNVPIVGWLKFLQLLKCRAVGKKKNK
jgi:hypothetical protein